MSDYHMIGVIGDAGNGKTTFMVRHIAREMALLTKYKKAHLNIHTSIPNTDYVYKMEDLEALRASNLTGVPDEILGIDQIHKYANPRRAMSEVNVQFNDIIIESRQHGFDLIFTTWGVRMVDPNVRKYVSLWVQAQRVARGFHYTYRLPDDTEIGNVLLTFENAAKWWAMFDTTELVEDIRPPKEVEV